MLSKRIVAIAADKAFAKRLSAGLMAAGGMVETAAAPEDLAKGEIAADLVVVHVTDGKTGPLEAVAARLKKDAHLIGVVDSSSLEQIVQVMKQKRVTSVLVADDLSPAALAAVASRVMYGDVFGLEKLVPWGVKVYSHLVGDYQEKSVAIAAVSDFASAMGVRRKYRESIEQCLDELLMNALYDAPVDSAGKQMFADVPTKTRISLRMEQKAVVQYACDGTFFAISVRDSFGALRGDTIVKYLDKCLHSDQQIDRKAGGAGLGLYIISNAATRFFVNIYPGVATEAICTFDLHAPKVQLKEFGVFEERIDSSGRLVAGGPSKLVAAGVPGAAGGVPAAAPASRGLTAALTAAILLLLALIAIVAYPRFATARGALAVSTSPPGAIVELDGRVVGSAVNGPLTVGDLVVGQKYKLTARLDGYEPVELIAEPRKGDAQPVNLTLRPRQSVVVLESDPPGATVVIGGQERGTTPLSLAGLPPGSEQTVTLKKSGYGDLTRTLRVPEPGREATVSWTMSMATDFGSIRIETDPPGAQVLQNGELLASLTTPVPEHIVTAGRTYSFTVKKKGYQPVTRELRVEAGKRGELVVKLEPGGGLTVDASLPEVRISVVGIAACTDRPAPMRDCPLPNGTYKVRLSALKPYVSEKFEVKIADAEAIHRFDFGFVEVEDSELVLDVSGGPRNLKRAAFPEGRHGVTVVNPKTKESVKKTVTVTAGNTTRVGLEP